MHSKCLTTMVADKSEKTSNVLLLSFIQTAILNALYLLLYVNVCRFADVLEYLGMKVSEEKQEELFRKFDKDGSG